VKGTPDQCSIDANFIFDLDTGGILEYPCRLGYTFLMADFVAYEVIE